MKTRTPRTDHPVILVDMDDTIADFTGTALRLWGEQHPGAFTLPFEAVTDFEFDTMFPEELRLRLRNIYREKGFCLGLPPLPHAVHALKEMVQDGIDVRILTAPLSTPACAEEKWRWTERHLGPEFTKRLIIAKDKTFTRGHLLIDDKPVITGSLTPLWTHVYFDRPWNATRPGPRLTGWADWRSLLTHLDAQ